MKIIDILKSDKVSFSCEVFPPKIGAELVRYKEIIDEIAELNPAYMSVTCGAGGTTVGHAIDIAKEVQCVKGVTALAHLTCIASDRERIKNTLDELKTLGIENILALRGDIPQGSDYVHSKDYMHASDLIKDIKSYGDFCVGGACYPEGHPESASLEKDIDNIKIKVDNGCDFLNTQMFFDNNILYSYMFHLLKKGVDVPVVAGIMPITNVKQAQNVAKLSGNFLPRKFVNIVEKFGNNPLAMKQAGIAYATEQIIDLIANGVKNIHLYTMNKPDIAATIMSNLSEIINK